MASAVRTLEAPDGSETKGLTFTTVGLLQIAVSEMGPDGEPSVELVAAPDGAHAMFVQRRMRGDFYAEFSRGPLITCSHALCRADAIRGAAQKMALA